MYLLFSVKLFLYMSDIFSVIVDVYFTKLIVYDVFSWIIDNLFIQIIPVDIIPVVKFIN